MTRIQTLEDLKQNRDRLNRKVFEALLTDRPSIGSQTKSTLRAALRLGLRPDLNGQTLLERSIHQAHTNHVNTALEKLANRAAGRARGLAQSERERLIRDRIRFVTILYIAEDLSPDTVIDTCAVFKPILMKGLKAGSKESIGAIEVEVVNTATDSGQLSALMQQAPAVDKLKTLHDLTPVWAKGSERLALIHYHGVVTLKEAGEQGVKLFRNELAKEGLCNVNRQTEISLLTEEFGGRKKTLRDNLFHIARYITKGGNKLVAGRMTFEYKTSFKQSDIKQEKELISGHRETGSDVRREKIEDGLENPLAMTFSEVLFQAIVIDRLMGSARDRRGYLIKT